MVWRGKTLPVVPFVEMKKILRRIPYRSHFILSGMDHLSQNAGKVRVDIPAKSQIGPGFKIEHLNGIVINPDVIVGKNCNIYNSITIAKRKGGSRIGCPIIGDQVWIGANVVVVGHIKIGNDVLIAPGAYVNFDVPSHSIVLGNPAKIIERENATREYIKNMI